jgi:hypothetical protein
MLRRMKIMLLNVGLGLSLALSLGLVACGSSAPPARSFPFEPSSVTPAAMGEVATTIEPNGNTKLTVNVQHLAPPDRVTPGATVYVVWVAPPEEGATATNLGALRVDADLRGKLEAVTPLRGFDLKITAEETPTVDEPHGTPVLSVRVPPRS